MRVASMDFDARGNRPTRFTLAQTHSKLGVSSADGLHSLNLLIQSPEGKTITKKHHDAKCTSVTKLSTTPRARPYQEHVIPTAGALGDGVQSESITLRVQQPKVY